MRLDAFSVGDAFYAAADKRWVSVLTQPIRDDAGRVAGLLVLPLDLLALNREVLTAGTGNALVAAGDRQGRIALRGVDPDAWIGRPFPARFIDETKGRLRGLLDIPGVDGVPRLYAFATVPGSGWRVVAGLAEAEVFGAHDALVKRAAAIGAIVLALALAIAWRITRGIVLPMRALAATSARVALGDLAARAALAGPAEITEVAKQFNEMLESLWRSEAALRESEEREVRASKGPTPGSGIWTFRPAGYCSRIAARRCRAISKKRSARAWTNGGGASTRKTWPA